MDSSIAKAAAQAKGKLREAARTHKRSAAAHRRSARELMQALELFEKECAKYGIKVVIETDQETKPKEAQSYGRPEDS